MQAVWFWRPCLYPDTTEYHTGILIAPLDTELLIQSFCIKTVPAPLFPRSMNKAVLKRLSGDFSGGPVVRLHVSNAGAWVRSLVWALRSYMPWGMAKKLGKKKKTLWVVQLPPNKITYQSHVLIYLYFWNISFLFFFFPFNYYPLRFHES